LAFDNRSEEVGRRKTVGRLHGTSRCHSGRFALAQRFGRLLQSACGMGQEFQLANLRKFLLQGPALDWIWRKYMGFAEKQHNAIRKAILELGGLGTFTEEEIYNGAKPKKLSKDSNKRK
jgi:hypothetical protein